MRARSECHAGACIWPLQIGKTRVIWVLGEYVFWLMQSLKFLQQLNAYFAHREHQFRFCVNTNFARREHLQLPQPVSLCVCLCPPKSVFTVAKSLFTFAEIRSLTRQKEKRLQNRLRRASMKLIGWILQYSLSLYFSSLGQ